MLEAIHLRTGYGQRVIGRDLSFALKEGEIVCLLGPNGGGKTTVFKTLLGLIPALAGAVRLDGRAIDRLERAEIARRLAYVPQAQMATFPFKVQDVVLMGRAARVRPWSTPSRADEAAALAALAQIGMADFAPRPYTQLSGGERQLILIARALAQAAPLFIMDEPTASLDLFNRHKVLGHLRRLAERGQGVLFSTHEPDHALAVADRVLLMRDGQLIGQGSPAEIMTTPMLQRLYRAPVEVIALPDGRRVTALSPPRRHEL